MPTTHDVKARLSIDTLLSHYGSVPDAHHRWSCLFPERHTNGDRHHSVTIATGRATCWSQKCFESADVFELIRLKEHCTFAEAMQRAAELAGLGGNGKPSGKIVAEYPYTEEAGTLLFQVVRYEPKDFRQRRPDGHGGWIWNLKDTRLVVYRLPDVLKADSVLLNAVQGISDLMTVPGLVNVDFADVRTIMSGTGRALMGTGIGTGKKRATEAAEGSLGVRRIEVAHDRETGVVRRVVLPEEAPDVVELHRLDVLV